MAGETDRTLAPAHKAQGSPQVQQGLLLPGGPGGQGAVNSQTPESSGLPERVRDRRTDLWLDVGELTLEHILQR